MIWILDWLLPDFIIFCCVVWLDIIWYFAFRINPLHIRKAFDNQAIIASQIFERLTTLRYSKFTHFNIFRWTPRSCFRRTPMVRLFWKFPKEHSRWYCETTGNEEVFIWKTFFWKSDLIGLFTVKNLDYILWRLSCRRIHPTDLLDIVPQHKRPKN